MRLFQKRWMAWIVLILAIAAAVGLGQLRRPANRGYDKYIDDRADLFSAKARQTLRDCNARWDSTYGVRLAVATLPGAPGQDLEDYGYRWGNDNGLTEWDMVLVLTADDWTVCPGDEIWEYLNDTYQTRLSAAVNGAKDDDEVVSRFCAALDDFYGHALRRTAANTAQKSAFPWGRVILVLLAVAVIWVLVDRARYRRYRRSVAALPTGATPVRRTTPYYYPVFWGRRTAPPRPPRPPPTSGGQHLSPGAAAPTQAHEARAPRHAAAGQDVSSQWRHVVPARQRQDLPQLRRVGWPQLRRQPQRLRRQQEHLRQPQFVREPQFLRQQELFLRSQFLRLPQLRGQPRRR